MESLCICVCLAWGVWNGEGGVVEELDQLQTPWLRTDGGDDLAMQAADLAIRFGHFAQLSAEIKDNMSKLQPCLPVCNPCLSSLCLKPLKV
ncbi:hypothetical protein COLO4_37062 [Corchorus olitorius]|uniref:Uncharacterized protein n=1 Tax=Corchorus olitorius TaxID=93759 RepID=A0A1R3G3H8_9ROSI|nr:hypothetical protein COLO4_37062 [Corchorus olitorius]